MTHLADLKLYQRLEVMRTKLAPVQSDYRIVFETDFDQTCSILVPDPNWMAAALHGDILPPLEVYHHLEMDKTGRVMNGHILHETAPISAMNEEQAIDYLLRKDTPNDVWKDTQRNRPLFNVTKKQHIPVNRLHRDAWTMDLDFEKPIEVDFQKAKTIQKKRLVDYFITSEKRKKEIEPYIKFDEALEQEFTMLGSMRAELSFDRLERAKVVDDLDHALPAPLLSQFIGAEMAM